MDKERARRLFLTAFFLFALANGLSGSIISNYFKDVFQVDSDSARFFNSQSEFNLFISIMRLR